MSRSQVAWELAYSKAVLSMNGTILGPHKRPSCRVSVTIFFRINVKQRHCSLLVLVAIPRLEIRYGVVEFCYATVYHIFVIPLFDGTVHDLDGRSIGRKEQCCHCSLVVHLGSNENVVRIY